MQINPKQIRQSQKAQKALHEYCFGFLYPICKRYKYQDEEARELFYLGFIKIIDKIETYNKTGSFKAWSSTVMKRTILDEIRRESRHRKHTKAVETYELNEPSTNDINDSIGEHSILHLLTYLPPMANKVFNMFAIEGYSHKEIADTLGITVSTSKWHMNSARTKLKSLVEKMNQNVYWILLGIISFFS